MSVHELIKEIYQNYEEWFEMTDQPQELLLGILANKLLGCHEHIQYLNKRLDNERINTRK